ncbi:MAG: hypothetical protein Q6367_006385 [Candidatus Freyarchaeota archaeon]
MVNEHLKDDKLVKHVLAVEAIMRNLAKYLGEDEELWGIVGLIHGLSGNHKLPRNTCHKNSGVSSGSSSPRSY